MGTAMTLFGKEASIYGAQRMTVVPEMPTLTWLHGPTNIGKLIYLV
jgi:hypothetical protein